MKDTQENVRIKAMISFPKKDLELLRSLAHEHGWGLGTIGNVYKRVGAPQTEINSTVAELDPEEKRKREEKLLAAIFGNERVQKMIKENREDSDRKI